MQPVHEILPGLIGDPKVTARKAKRSRRKNPPGLGVRNLFPPLEILRPAWEHVVGPLLFKRTRPVSLIGNRLVVEAPDVRWRVQLVRYEGAILDRIRRLLGEDSIHGIDWKINPALAVEAEPAPARKPPQRELDFGVRKAADGIRDPELRELFLRQAARLSG
jgi:hypothetical protein